MSSPHQRSRLEIVLILGALTAFAPLSIDMYLPALALLTQHQGVGAASALLGVLQFGIGAGAALGVGALENGTAMPMGLVIGLCGLGSCLARRLLVRPPS
ncbi:MAG TPA: hypothetical protein VJL84_01670 [Kiloniellales bacterium]|nr:hypothetical protein [Kiloniellales bacterium]